jgi:hypothetical protein
MATAVKNTKGKTVKRENAYEVFATTDLSWVWYVLKHWSSSEKEATDPYARVFCEVFSPMTAPGSDLGDVYLREIKANAFDARQMLQYAKETIANADVSESVRNRAVGKAARLEAILAGRYN